MFEKLGITHNSEYSTDKSKIIFQQDIYVVIINSYRDK